MTKIGKGVLVLLLMVVVWVFALSAVLFVPVFTFLSLLLGPTRWNRIFKLCDHLCNVLVFDGDWWETVSSHVGRLCESNPPRWAVSLNKILDVAQKDHAKEARGREQKVVDYLRSLN